MRLVGGRSVGSSSSFRGAARRLVMSAQPLVGVAVGAAKFASLTIVAGTAAAYAFQRQLLFIPPAVVADVRRLGATRVLVDTHEASTVAGVGAFVTAAYYAAASNEAPVVVYWHGNADQVGWSACWLGRELSSTTRGGGGVGLFGVEYPGYGGSDGRPSQAAIVATSLLAIRHLTTHLAVDPSRVVLVGQSVGAGVASEVAARWPALYGAPARCVLISPFASIVDMAATLFPFLPRPALWLLVKDPFDNVQAMTRLDPATEVLVLHGQRDTIVPIDQGQQVAAAFPGADFRPLPKVGHNDVFDDPTVIPAILNFANRLRDGPPRVKVNPAPTTTSRGGTRTIRTTGHQKPPSTSSSSSSDRGEVGGPEDRRSAKKDL